MDDFEQTWKDFDTVFKSVMKTTTKYTETTQELKINVSASDGSITLAFGEVTVTIPVEKRGAVFFQFERAVQLSKTVEADNEKRTK